MNGRVELENRCHHRTTEKKMLLHELPTSTIVILLVFYLGSMIAALRSHHKPLPELWHYYPTRVRSAAAKRIMSDRLTPVRSTMSPRARHYSRIAAASSMAEESSMEALRAGVTLRPLPGRAGTLDTEEQADQNA